MIEQAAHSPRMGMPPSETGGGTPDINPEHKGKLQKMTESIGTFLGDVGKANELAKGKLDKNTAIEHVLRGAAVTSAGVVGEFLSDAVWDMASEKIATIGKGKLTDFLKKGTVIGEMTENLAIMAGYNWVSGQTGKVLPSPIPAQYLGLSLAIDAVDKGLLKPADPNKRSKLDFSNAVTVYGVSMITNGIVTFGKELKAIRKARALEGTKGIEKLFYANARAEKEEKIKHRAERFVKMLDGEEKKNGDGKAGEKHGN